MQMPGPQSSHMRLPATLVLLLALATLLPVACSSGSRQSPAAEPASPQAAEPAAVNTKDAANAHAIQISGFKFDPAVLTVNVGDTVEWKNADDVAHTATARDKTFDSGQLATGASWKYVAAKKGS